MSLLFDLVPPSVAISGSAERFPVRRIYCVGQNYAAHAREMGSDGKTPPFFFMKPADAVHPGGKLSYPADTANLHHEVELVLAISKGGANIAADAAWEHVFGCAVGIDLTRRDRQAEAKADAKPWERAKSFDASAPISPIVKTRIERGAISFSVNGAVRQSSDIADMIWSPVEIIAALSKSWTLAPGDLIFTGTPEGVGPLVRGDTGVGKVEGVGEISIEVV